MTLDEILSRFDGVRKVGPNEWKARCSHHRDTEPSLAIKLAGHKLLLNCHAGCETADVLRDARLTFRDLNLSLPARTSARLALAAFAEAKALPVDFLRQLGVEEDERGLRITYRLADGTPAPRQRRRTALAAKDGSTWDGPKGAAPVAYGLWRLEDAREKGELLLLEGETDTLSAWLHNVPALGIPGADMAKVLTADTLGEIERLDVLQEPDQGGATFVRGIRSRLAALGWQGRAFTFALPNAVKDLNDLHRAAGSDFARILVDARAAGVPLSVRATEDEALAPRGTAGPDASDYLEPIAVFLAEQDPPVRVVFPDLLPCGVILLLHGEPRARKSLAAFELALAAATGTAPFGLARFTPAAPINVLYIQEEDPRALTRPRVRRLVRERCGGTLPATLHVAVRRGIDLDDPVWVARIIADCRRLGIRFVVLDAARRLSIKTDEGPAKVRELIAVLRAIVSEADATLAVVHHDIKPAATGQDLRRRGQRASGGDWFAASECPVHVERVGDGETLVYPQDYKFSSDPAPFTFSCLLDGALVKQLVGRDTTTQHAETAGVRGTLLAWIRAHGPASKTAMKTAGFGWETIRAAVDALLRDGLLDAMPGRTAMSQVYFATPSEASPKVQDGSTQGRGHAA